MKTVHAVTRKPPGGKLSEKKPAAAKNDSVKKRLTLLMLFCRSTSAAMILILCLMTAAELLLAAGRCPRRPGVTLEACIEKSGMMYVFSAAVLALALCLMFSYSEFGSRSGYTLRRLRVPEREVFFLQSVWHLICFLTLGAWQILLLLGLGRWYAQTWAAIGREQSVFLAAGRNLFMHILIPVGQPSLLIRNLLWALGLSLLTAAAPVRMRGGRWPEFAVLPAYLLLLFAASPGEWRQDMVVTAIVSVIAAIELLTVRRTREEGDV